jgi:hypothetical protein
MDRPIGGNAFEAGAGRAGYTDSRGKLQMKTQSRNLDTFIRRTQKLARQLRALMKRYPEDHLEPDQRIFNRLLTNDWRYPSGQNVCLELRYSEAVRCVDDLRNYHSELVEFCRYELNAVTKLVELPMNPWLRLSGSECARQLELQAKVLGRWKHDDTSSPPLSRVAKIRCDLQRLADQRGLKNVAAAIHRNVDTLRDFLTGKTRPQEKTIERIESWLKRHKPND